MSLIDQIEKIQKKSERTKRKIMIFTVFAIMSAIILIWIKTFNLKKEVYSDNYAENPFSALAKTASPTIEGIKEMFKNATYAK